MSGFHLARLAIIEGLGPTAAAFRDPLPAPHAVAITPILDECA